MDVDTRLELADLDTFWLPSDARRIWRADLAYIACDRDAPFLNCGLAMRASDEDVPALLDEVAAAHARVRSRWKLCGGTSGPVLEAGLAARGYAATVEHRAFAIAPADYHRPVPDDVSVTEIAGLDDLVAATGVTSAAFGRSTPTNPALLAAELVDCTRPGRRILRFLARDRRSGQPLSSGGLNLYPRLGLGLLWAGGTVPAARGRGAYTALVAARLRAAAREGLDLVGVYARIDSSAPILARQGFAAHGPMTWWERPTPG
jgi:hypothetical protein